MLATPAAELEELLIAVADRNGEAFRRVYEIASPKLYGIILRITRSRPLADEVLQDVFLRVWQNAVSFSPALGPARAWLNTIARNRAIDVVRQRGAGVPVEPTGGDKTDWFERIPEERDREADAIDNASLRFCLGTLDQQTRDCVLLAYYEGFSREELAQRFERPVNTIKTWLHRSLATLRACLDGEPS